MSLSAGPSAKADHTYRVDTKLRELDESGISPFQIAGARWLAKPGLLGHRKLLADEQGTGKSVQIIRAGMGHPMVIACPKSLKLSWRDQFRKWAPQIEVTVINPGTDLRAPNPDEVIIISIDSLPDVPSASRFRNATIVYDEAHKLKGEYSERAKRARANSKVFKRVWLATGTPMPGTPDDLWNVLRAGLLTGAFEGGRAEFEKAFGWEDRWPEVVPDPSIIRGALGKIMLRRLRSEVLPELPDKIYETLPFEVPEEMVEELREYDAAWHAIGLHKRPPFELTSRVQAELARARIEPLLEYVEDRPEPLIVFSIHTEPIEALAEIEGWATITGERTTINTIGGEYTEEKGEKARKRAVDAFQQSRGINNIALTIGVGGAGLTLTRGNHVVRVSRAWTPAENWQAEDRIARFGQAAKSLLITDIISDHPAEYRLLDVCAEKSGRIAAVL